MWTIGSFVLLLTLFQLHSADDAIISTNNESTLDSNTAECMATAQTGPLTAVIATSILIPLACVLVAFACFLYFSSKKLEDGACTTERFVHALMDQSLRNGLATDLCNEINWRAHCVRLRQNAKHQRRQNRALGIHPAA